MSLWDIASQTIGRGFGVVACAEPGYSFASGRELRGKTRACLANLLADRCRIRRDTVGVRNGDRVRSDSRRGRAHDCGAQRVRRAACIGHACGHNLIAISGVAADWRLRSAKSAEARREGTVRVLGSPAEEGGGGKIRRADEGAFEDVGAAMMIHPGTGDIIYPFVLAIDTCFVELAARTRTRPVRPGRVAMHSMRWCWAYQAIGLLRQQRTRRCGFTARFIMAGRSRTSFPTTRRPSSTCARRRSSGWTR